jgi:hypothetical protein
MTQMTSNLVAVIKLLMGKLIRTATTTNAAIAQSTAATVVAATIATATRTFKAVAGRTAAAEAVGAL